MGKWKFLKAGSREFLFDLETQEQENKNWIKEFPEMGKKMKENMEIWAKELHQPGIYDGKIKREKDFYDFYFKV
jgi:hypothetical protein